jgi:Undecaprenyl-phosphate glucose phosphotransferase
MLRERNETYMLFFAAMDMLATFAAFWAAFVVRFILQEPDLTNFYSISIREYMYIGIVLVISQVLIFYFMDMYGPGKIGLLTEEFSSVVTGTILAIVVALGVIFFLKTHRYSRLVMLYFGVINVVFISLGRAFARAFINRLLRRGKRLRYILVLGTGKGARHVEYVIQRNRIYGYLMKGFVRLPGETDSRVEDEKIVGDFENLSRILTEMHPSHVMFVADNADGELLHKAIQACSHEGIHMHVVPSFSELITSRGRLESLEGLPLITLRDIPARRGLNRFIKRVFDTLFSLLFIVLFSPFYILIALSIALTSKGPILLKQERVGLDNNVFNLLKFRTMYTQQPEESDTVWTTKNDPRVTPVGRFLRKLSLDETPQFFNVLTGKMSVVGPRPERPYWVEQFKEEYTGYMQRHGMKAGITGWAQINGLRGDTSIEERVAADIYYIENWSFLLDLKIILMTPFKSIFDRNAY